MSVMIFNILDDKGSICIPCDDHFAPRNSIVSRKFSTIQFRLQKFLTCDKTEICQANEHPIKHCIEYERCYRGTYSGVKTVLRKNYS